MRAAPAGSIASEPHPLRTRKEPAGWRKEDVKQRFRDAGRAHDGAMAHSVLIGSPGRDVPEGRAALVGHIDKGALSCKT